MQRIILLCLVLIFACKQNPKATSPSHLVLHFTADSTGNIAEPEVRDALKEIASDIRKNASKIIIHAYSENSGDSVANKQIAHDMAWTAKRWLRAQGARDYNVGLDIHGYENPLVPNQPQDIKNRRIEIERLN